MKGGDEDLHGVTSHRKVLIRRSKTHRWLFRGLVRFKHRIYDFPKERGPITQRDDYKLPGDLSADVY